MSVETREVKSLTGLRGAAALWVVAFHCHLVLPSHPLPEVPFAWGYLGVDVFFVLSGYMLSSLYPGLNVSQSKAFFLRRAARILPLHFTVMCFLGIMVLSASCWQNPQPYYAARAFIPVLLLVQVPLGVSGWNDPAWSISVEMICYLSLPLVMPMLQKIQGRLLLILATMLLVADIFLLYLSGPQGFRPAIHQLTGWFPILRAILGFYAGCILSRCLILEDLQNSPLLKLFGWRPVVILGEISFSVYLIHQPVLGLGKRLDVFLAAHHLDFFILPLLAGMILSISFLTYYVIENPGRNLVKRLRRDPVSRRGQVSTKRELAHVSSANETRINMTSVA